MDDKKIIEKDVPYIVLESVICRFDRVIKRLWVVILILIFLLLGTNLAWLYYESQFEEVTQTTEQTVTQDTKDGGDNSFIGGDSYGETGSEDRNDQKD